MGIQGKDLGNFLVKDRRLSYIDKVLKVLADSSENSNECFSMLSLKDIEKGLENPLPVNEIILILAKLVKDQYCHFEPALSIIGLEGNVDRWNITYDGYVFLLDGGYQEEVWKRLRAEERLEKIEEVNAKNQTRMIWLTLLVAIGTAIAAIYYAQQIWQFCHAN